MPKRKTRIRRVTELTPRKLSPRELFDLVLVVTKRWGPHPTFASDEARKKAWIEHREEIMDFDWGIPGIRPGAFWDYEAKELPREGETEAQCLLRLGLLEAWEREALA